MPRTQDVMFGLLGIVIVALLTLQIRVVVLAVVGAFVCGSLYVFAGMLPARTERLSLRLFTSVFLAIVLSCLVLIVPGTFGLRGPQPELQKAVIAVAAFLPFAAICFEVLRTPRVAQTILRCLGRYLR